MKQTVDLSLPNTLPERFIARLEAFDGVCVEIEFSEKLVEIPEIADLVSEINNYCESNRIIGYHYTRADPEQIRKNGLLVRSGKEIRETFLVNYGHLFREDEREEMKRSWAECFHECHSQPQSRDYRLFFNFTQKGVEEGGAEPLLSFFGGEQINMCFDNDSSIMKKLSSLGEPLILRCVLNPSDVHAFIENPWGKIAVSSYHLSKNPRAYRIDQDGYQLVPVPPDDIEIHQALTSSSSPTGYAPLNLRLS